MNEARVKAEVLGQPAVDLDLIKRTAPVALPLLIRNRRTTLHHRLGYSSLLFAPPVSLLSAGLS